MVHAHRYPIAGGGAKNLSENEPMIFGSHQHFIFLQTKIHPVSGAFCIATCAAFPSECGSFVGALAGCRSSQFLGKILLAFECGPLMHQCLQTTVSCAGETPEPLLWTTVLQKVGGGFGTGGGGVLSTPLPPPWLRKSLFGTSREALKGLKSAHPYPHPGRRLVQAGHWVLGPPIRNTYSAAPLFFLFQMGLTAVLVYGHDMTHTTTGLQEPNNRWAPRHSPPCCPVGLILAWKKMGLMVHPMGLKLPCDSLMAPLAACGA